MAFNYLHGFRFPSYFTDGPESNLTEESEMRAVADESRYEMFDFCVNFDLNFTSGIVLLCNIYKANSFIE